MSWCIYTQLKEYGAFPNRGYEPKLTRSALFKPKYNKSFNIGWVVTQSEAYTILNNAFMTCLIMLPRYP